MHRFARTALIELAVLVMLTASAVHTSAFSAPIGAQMRPSEGRPNSSSVSLSVQAFQDPYTVNQSPSRAIRTPSPDQESIARWALMRFARAGLALPPVTIRTNGSKHACGGNAGVSRVVEGTRVIETCTNARWTLLHELAHAWAADNLTSAERAAFVEVQGLSGWTGPDIDWGDRGTEQAADLVAWALLDSIHIPGNVWRGSVVKMQATYEMLTGQPLPFNETIRRTKRTRSAESPAAAPPPVRQHNTTNRQSPQLLMR